MAASAGFIELIGELMAPLGPIRFRRMFSGTGVFDGEVMFALIVQDTLYLKADEVTRQPFEAERQEPFSYQGKSKRVVLPYWRLPERLLDDPDEFQQWARAAMRAARQRHAKTKAHREPKPRARKKGRSGDRPPR